MSKLIKDLGAVSAYAYAVEKGYTGTEDEFAELMYDYTDVAQTAVEAKDEAVSASASAQASATTANTKADEASASASKAQSASDSAQGAETNAETFALNAGTKATEAKQFADKAELNAQKTQSDKEAVESAKSDVLSAVDNAQNYANSAQSASQAIQNMDVEATTLEPDSDATVEKTVDAISGAVTLTYGIPKGQVGEKGDKGDTGGSGVYIGTSAPSDENVNVWIDSDGEPDDVIQIDDTLTQSGQAADSKAVGDKIADLKSAIDEGADFYDEELGIEFRPLKGTARSTDTPYSENKIIDTPLNANKTYRITWSIPTAISVPVYVFLSDGNGNNLIAVNIPVGDTEYVRDYTPNNNYSNAFLYFTVGNVPTVAVTGSVSMINVSPTRIDNLEAAVDALEDTTVKKVESRSVEITNPDTGHYINKNGGYSASNPFSISQAFNVYAGETIEVIATGYNNETAIIAQVKSDYPYTVLARSRSSVEETYTYTALEDMSVVVSYDNRKPCTITVKKIYDLDVIPQMQAALRDAKWKYAFDRICCIGDSLTSGAYYAGTWGGASIAQNYPNILSRMLNTTVKNSSRSGASAKTWYTNNMAGLTLSDYGTFVIWLGTNQGLTDTIATDVDPYDDYNDFGDTNTGYLCRTICQIKEAVPDAHIMICTVFSTSGDLATTNNVINQVASKYALQLVDNSDLDNANYPLYHSNAVHFNKAGNIFVADRIMNAMIGYVAPDSRNAEFGLSARTD